MFTSLASAVHAVQIRVCGVVVLWRLNLALAMPPRKKQRNSAATSVAGVHPIQNAVADWVQDAFDKRKSVGNDADGRPVEVRKSFLMRIRDALQDKNSLITASMQLAQSTRNFPTDLAEEEFKERFLKVGAWPPRQGRSSTCILSWSMTDASLWKGENAMSEVLPRALTIARSSLSEALKFANANTCRATC